MADSITTPAPGNQAESLLRQREKEHRADLERWEVRRKELSDDFEKNTRKEWERQAHHSLMAEARGLNFRPPGMAALGNHATPEQVMDYARAEVDRRKFEWLKAEREAFLDAQRAEREQQAARAQDRARQEPEAAARNLAPRSFRPNRDHDPSRYAALRQPASGPSSARDEDKEVQAERNRARVRELLERQRGQERERER